MLRWRIPCAHTKLKWSVALLKLKILSLVLVQRIRKFRVELQYSESVDWTMKCAAYHSPATGDRASARLRPPILRYEIPTIHHSVWWQDLGAEP